MKERIYSIDIVRGLIMIIMTLDHVRDFLHFPAAPPLNMHTTTAILFFTRWITHFCAPTFVFLSGVSAFLAGQRRSKAQLTSFLLKRGAWLILSDVLIITLLFTFDLRYHLIVLEVLTAIGFGMIILALLSHTRLWVIASVGVIIVFGHNMFDYMHIQPHTFAGYFTTVFFTAVASFFPVGGNRTVVELYAMIPWTGAMLLGYSFGTLFRAEFSGDRRRKILLMSGVGLCGLFVLLRLINLYGDPAPWSVQRNAAHTFLSFLNATKQPPSLLFLSMTLGPVLILLSLAEKLKGRFASICRVYGNVPYFYFILHLCLIRVINVSLIPLQGIPLKSTETLVWQAAGFGYPLWAVYLFWLLVVAIMYFPCKWYGTYKQSHKQWWHSYM